MPLAFLVINSRNPSGLYDSDHIKTFKSFLPWYAGFRLPRAAITRTLSRLIFTESGSKRGAQKLRAAWRPLSTYYFIIWHDVARIATCFEEAKDDACIYDRSKALAFRIAREQSRIQACYTFTLSATKSATMTANAASEMPKLAHVQLVTFGSLYDI